MAHSENSAQKANGPGVLRINVHFIIPLLDRSVPFWPTNAAVLLLFLIPMRRMVSSWTPRSTNATIDNL
jgi:hypothetical protein